MAEPIEIVKKSLLRKPSPEVNMLDYGRLPPQAKELEEAVLGAIMIEDKAIGEVVELLQPDSFYVDAHQRIYRAIIQLFQASSPIDLLTVTEQLKKNGELDAVGGQYYIAVLTNKVGGAGNIEYHARIIHEKHIQRQLISAASEIIKNAYEDTTDVFDLLDKSCTDFENINLQLNGQSQSTWADKVIQTENEVMDAALNDGKINGVPTLFKIMDHHQRGWQKCDLIIIAARPSMGKTSFVLYIAMQEAAAGIPVAFFSLEMRDGQLIKKMFAAQARIHGKTLRTGELNPAEWENLRTTADTIGKWPIHLDDTGGLSINQLCARAKMLVRKHKVQVIYVDYLQLLTTHDSGRKFGTREQEISHISSRLKRLAKELKIPVIALSQLSREPEKRQGLNKRPQLSDLREGGSIEQDADMVGFCFRPAYYGLDEDENGPFPKGLMELKWAKVRDGELCTLAFIFDMAYSSFKEYSDEPENTAPDIENSNIPTPPFTQPKKGFRKLTPEEQTDWKENTEVVEEKDDDLPF